MSFTKLFRPLLTPYLPVKNHINPATIIEDIAIMIESTPLLSGTYSAIGGAKNNPQLAKFIKKFYSLENVTLPSKKNIKVPANRTNLIKSQYQLLKF